MSEFSGSTAGKFPPTSWDFNLCMGTADLLPGRAGSAERNIVATNRAATGSRNDFRNFPFALLSN